MNASDAIKTLITRRRRQMIVHSFIYYRLGTSLIDDKTFDRWAYELKAVQDANPTLAAECPFHKAFATWDGTTGYDLPMWDAWVCAMATQLLRYKREVTQDGT